MCVISKSVFTVKVFPLNKMFESEIWSVQSVDSWPYQQLSVQAYQRQTLQFVTNIIKLRVWKGFYLY